MLQGGRRLVEDDDIHPRNLDPLQLHPHVAGAAGGVAIGPSTETEDYLDYLGHGTAVAAAIREKAAEAQIYPWGWIGSAPGRSTAA